MRRFPVLALLSLPLLACGTGRSGSPICGLAFIAGPTVIYQQLADARMIVTEAPRGLPATLPALVGGQSRQSSVLVGYDQGHHLTLGYQGDNFPAPGAGYALLVVDDTSQRVQGVIIYESTDPKAVQIGSVIGKDGANTIPLYGVRVDWSGVSNPKCPLLGDSVRTAR
jgi:hypothetical protein